MVDLYNYSTPLHKDEVIVYLHKIGDSRDFELIKSQISLAARTYDFTFIEIENVYEKLRSKSKIELCIIVTDFKFDKKLSEDVVSLLLNEKFSTISIIHEYSSIYEMSLFNEEINKIKTLTNDRINYLRPDLISNGKCKVSIQKVVDNSICDGVRIKYKAVSLSSQLVLMNDECKNFFVESSKLYEYYKLYHRSCSDGYFAVRSETNASSFYITSTKTYKNNLDLSRISEVVEYDELTNEIYYKGKYLPSSDSVEAAIVFKRKPQVNAIIHTHASDRFTRNPLYEDKIGVPLAPYGEFKTGILLEQALTQHENFVIMKEHGEVFTSNNKGIPQVLQEYLR